MQFWAAGLHRELINIKVFPPAVAVSMTATVATAAVFVFDHAIIFNAL